MNDLPRGARWSLIAAIVLGLLLAGLGAGAVIGSQGSSSATGPSKVRAATGSNALEVHQTGSGTGIQADAIGGSAAIFSSTQSDTTKSITAGSASYGVYAANDSDLNAGGAAVRAQGNQNDGVVATSDNALAAAVRGQNGTTNGVAIWGSNPGTGIGVFGVATGSPGAPGPIVGVAGQAGSANGIGIFGFNQTGGQAGYFSGAVTVTRDLDVRGAIVGYTAVPAFNGSSLTMSKGDAVSILGVRHGPSGSYLLVVGPASRGQAVVGIVDRQVKFTTVPVPGAQVDGTGALQASSSNATVMARVSDTSGPGSTLLVVTGGIVSVVNVSADTGPVILGALLVAGDTPGQLVAAGPSPAPGTVVGYALQSVVSGTTQIAVLVQPR